MPFPEKIGRPNIAKIAQWPVIVIVNSSCIYSGAATKVLFLHDIWHTPMKLGHLPGIERNICFMGRSMDILKQEGNRTQHMFHGTEYGHSEARVLGTVGASTHVEVDLAHRCLVLRPSTCSTTKESITASAIGGKSHVYAKASAPVATSKPSGMHEPHKRWHKNKWTTQPTLRTVLL